MAAFSEQMFKCSRGHLAAPGKALNEQSLASTFCSAEGERVLDDPPTKALCTLRTSGYFARQQSIIKTVLAYSLI